MANLYIPSHGFVYPSAGDFLDTVKIDNEKQLIPLLRYLPGSGNDPFDFACTDSFYRTISADNFSGIIMLAWQHGIKWMSIGVNERLRYIRLSNILFDKIDFSVVRSPEEVRRAFIRFSAVKRPCFGLIAADDSLLSQLTCTGGAESMASGTGIQGMQLKKAGHCVLIDSIRYSAQNADPSQERNGLLGLLRQLSGTQSSSAQPTRPTSPVSPVQPARPVPPVPPVRPAQPTARTGSAASTSPYSARQSARTSCPQTVSGTKEFCDAVSYYADRKASEFVLTFDRTFYSSVVCDQQKFKSCIAESRLSAYSYASESSSPCSVRFTNVTFICPNISRCTTERQIADALHTHIRSGNCEFVLMLNDSLFRTVYANNFERLLELETEARIVNRSMSYNDRTYRIIYSNVKSDADAPYLSCIGEAVKYLEMCAERGDREINLFCSESLYRILSVRSTGNGEVTYRQSVVSNAGIFDCRVMSYDSKCLHCITVNRYYPGTAIITAVRKGNLSSLTEREKRTYEIAKRLAAEYASNSPLTTARLIHDDLCRRTNYTRDDITDKDTAIGVLLDGRADCDGYSDAFYLIGTLAGLDVRHQLGKSAVPNGSNPAEQHMWNLIRINRTWRLIDVTWDDEKEGICYLWFNIGLDRARSSHYWIEDASMPLLERTVSTERPMPEFSIASSADAGQAFRTSIRNNFSECVFLFDRRDADACIESILQALRNCPEIVRYSYYSWKAYGIVWFYRILYR